MTGARCQLFVGPLDIKNIFDTIKCLVQNYDMKIAILKTQQTANDGPPLSGIYNV